MKVAGLIVVALSASLAACGVRVQSEAMEAVAAQMKDPASAQFRGLKSGKTGTGFVFVCGEVNAKNSYGGYNGYRPFLWREGTYGVRLTDDKGELAFLVNDYIAAQCAGRQQAYLDQVIKTERYTRGYSQEYIETLRLDMQAFEAP
jgi:hypothetical protein